MNIMRNAFKRTNYVLCLLLALSGASCINRLNDEIKEGSILISFSFETSKAATKVTKNTFDIGDRSGIFAMLTGNSLDQQRYIDNLLLECSDNSKLISKKEVYYPEGDATLDFISYYPYQEENVSKGSSLLNVTVQADQNKTANYSLSNFMTARIGNVPNSEKTVKLEYKHRFAKIKLVLIPQEGEDTDEMLKANPRIIATGFRTQAVYDLQSDKLSSVDDASETDIIPFGTWKKEGNTLSGKEFIVIPQTHSDGGQAFTLEWNGKSIPALSRRPPLRRTRNWRFASTHCKAQVQPSPGLSPTSRNGSSANKERAKTGTKSLPYTQPHYHSARLISTGYTIKESPWQKYAGSIFTLPPPMLSLLKRL